MTGRYGRSRCARARAAGASSRPGVKFCGGGRVWNLVGWVMDDCALRAAGWLRRWALSARRLTVPGVREL